MSGLRERMNRLRGTSKPPESERQEVVSIEPEQKTEQIQQEPFETSMQLVTSGREGTEELEELSPEWELLGVRQAWNEDGEFLIRKRIYPLKHQHGLHQLGDLQSMSAHLATIYQHRNRKNESAASSADDIPSLQPEQMLFLDLETTGLGVGTGNVPFMVGIAYIQQDKFIVEQFLIRHPAEERAMLRYLIEKLGSFRWLVTYNGKSFDWPLVESRFIMNGLGRKVWEPLHLDLLHPSRSIWKNTLVSCKLSHVEEERLGIIREDDVPGSLAPAIYIQFLADGDPSPLEGVFRHNELDMLSLATLAVRFGMLLGGEIGQRLEVPVDPEELLRTGLWLEKMSCSSAAEPLFEPIAEHRAVRASTLLALGMRDKKVGNWQRAVLLWQKAASTMEQASIPSWAAHVELAMYYEHKCKDYERAFDFASGALSLALRSDSLVRNYAGGKRKEELQALRKRKERLLMKLGRSQNSELQRQ